MRLIGVPNSPYFRRAAISLELLKIPFEVVSLSPFIDVQALAELNPVMKVPTLICDNDEQIMDSSLIIQYAESRSKLSLWPTSAEALQTDLKVVSLALAALEKCLQIIYETRLRPDSSHHQPWLDRIEGQCQAAFIGIDKAVAGNRSPYTDERSQAAITAAVAWRFGSQSVAGELTPELCPTLASLSNKMESLPIFEQYA